MPRSDAELVAIGDSVALVGRLSDSLIRVGSFNLGVDAALSWIPGVGELYSTLAGGFIVVQGARAGVPASVLIAATGLLLVRTVTSAVPIAGVVFADMFTAHRWASAMVVRAIERRRGQASSVGVAARREPAGATAAV